MAFQILPLEDKDAKIFYQIVALADGDSLFARNFWVNGVTEAGQNHSAALAIADMQDPAGTNKFMKVVDPSFPDDDPMNKILSVAQWKIYPTERTPEDIQAEADKNKARGVPPGSNPEFLEDIFGQFGAAKTELVGTKPHVHLQMLFTRPEGFRRGAGAMHLAWGLAEADKLGIPTYLEASTMGRPLYQRVGFEPLRQLHLDSTKWNIGPDDVVTCMMRPAKAQPASGS